MAAPRRQPPFQKGWTTSRILNPNRSQAASYFESIDMKRVFLSCTCWIVVAWSALGQVSPGPADTTSTTPTPLASGSPSEDLADRIQQRIDQKLKRHIGATASDHDTGEAGLSDVSERLAVPIVGIVFVTLFGAPVLIVALIMYFGFSKNRMMHKTIRLMVEKGQPVPPALLAPPPSAVRQRSDMRRGVVLVMVGLGLMLFLGVVNEGEDGAWAVGIIPFLIGIGYLLVWKLEGRKDIPPLPPPT
jgi:hypothetical protein